MISFRTLPSILHLRMADSGGEGATFLADLCRRTTPDWEFSASGVYLDLTGTERLYGRGLDGAEQISRWALERVGVESRPLGPGEDRDRGTLAAGTGPSRLTAGLASLTAARAGGGVLAVLPAQVSAFLKPFPVNFLPARRSVVGRLQQLGVRTLGDLQVVPPSLLGSVFGPDGRRLADEARGTGTRLHAGGPGNPVDQATGLVLVVGIRLPRPISNERLVSALYRGMAIRALTCCPGGPARRGRWRLTVMWAEGRRDSASAPGSAHSGWQSWLGLMDLLRRRLPLRRQGMLGAELRAELPGAGSVKQGNLFAAHETDDRLEEVLRHTGKKSSGRLIPASEGLLATRGAVWYGPGAGMSQSGQGFG